jgi:putative transposase
MIEQIISEHDFLSVRRQCNLLDFNRSTFYYEHKPMSDRDLDIMERIDHIYTDHPFMGSRRIKYQLRDEYGIWINRKKVQRLMRLMGIEAIYPKKNLSQPSEKDKKYPYLLKKLKIDRPNLVWSTDITYIRVGRGYAYLVAIMDWYSRKVLSWRLSSTIDTAFCLEALREAMDRYGTPEIFNSDQGSQFTSHEFTWTLEEKKIRISRDSKGRAFDNIFIERLWRTVKYEEIFLKNFETMDETRIGLEEYFEFYNSKRHHQNLGYKTPDEIYGTGDIQKKAS